MTRRVTLVATTVLLLFVAVREPLASASHTVRTSAATEYLRLESASPWVEADGTWTGTWTVVNEPPPDATLDYTIHQSIAGSGSALRTTLAGMLGGASSGPNLQSRVSTPLAQLRTGSSVTLSLPIRSRSDGTDRILLPNAGVHPLDLAVSAPDGTVLQSEILFINHLPVTANRPPLKVAPMLAVRSRPVLSPVGAITVDDSTTATIGEAVTLLGSAGTVPISTLIDPQLLTTLTTRPTDLSASTSTTPTSLPAAADPTEQLRSLAATQPAIRATWVPIDMESWATTGTLADIQASTVAGQTATAQGLGHGAEVSVWPTDPTIGPASLPSLRSIGVQHLIVNPDRLVARSDLGNDPGTTRTFRLESPDSGIDALALDPTLTIRLHDSSVPAGDAAARVLTELAAIWFSTPAGVSPAVVLDLTGVPADVATKVTLGLATPNPTLSLVDLPTLFDGTSQYQTGSKRKEPLVRRLQPTKGSHDVGVLSRQLAALRIQVAAHRSTMGPTVPDGFSELLLTAQHRDLDPAAARRYGDAVAGRIATDFAHISAPPSRTVTVTARRATLPVLINNSTGHDVSVQLRFRGTRFEFTDGPIRAAELRPGSNALNVPVLARTSGDLPLVVEIRSADGQVIITRTRLRVHSTVVSGVGIVLGGGALAFLVLWWGLTIRRDRRSRRDPDNEEPREEEQPSVA